MSKNLKMSLFLDFYGQLLTPRQRDIMELYYYEDLSLSEISEHKKITRQGVHECIKHSERTLAEFEQKLQLADRFSKLNSSLDEILKTAENIKNSGESVSDGISHIIETAEKAQEFI